ncbi:MAG: hypothetical protein Q8K82_21870 [Gemmatimonadaceae bacterium]|nr:hypothetical protein [Gemmatimonadaceae bacterium]
MPFKPVTPARIVEELSDHLEFLNDVCDERRDITRLGNVCEEMCTHYRALGICLLSESADMDGFFHYLIQSALTRRHYLQGVSSAGGGDPRHSRASFIDPAFDAIAARQWRLAGDIFGSVAHEWTVGEEYEDDFCYAEFIRRLVTVRSDGADELLARWREALEGGVDLRLDVATALRAADANLFDDTLLRLLQSQEAKARAIADPVDGSLAAEDATFYPNRWVSIEGLALLAVARREGLTVTDELPACPPLARSSEFTAFRPRGYPNLPFENE